MMRGVNPVGARARLEGALRNTRVACFDHRALSQGRGEWLWSGSHFGISGIDGADGEACFLRAVLPEDRDALASVLSLLSADRSRSSEVRLPAPNGGTIYLLCEAHSENDRHGRPAAVTGVVRDVTGERLFEADLTEIVRRNRVLLATIDACPISITVADATKPGTPMIYANRMFTQITGYDGAEAIGRTCGFLHGPDTDPALVARMRHIVAAGEQAEIEIVNYRRDGSKFLNRLLLAPIHDDSGRLTAFIGMQSDVTQEAQRKLAEDQRQKMEALGRMMGGVAHEINNMLQPVTLLAQEVLDSDLVVGEGRGHIDILLDCSLKARNIIGDLLAFSRPTQSRHEIRDPVQVLNESLRLVRPAVPPGVTLAVTIAGQPPPIAVDRTAFTQILLNLIGNAVAAMDDSGEVTLTLDEHIPPLGSAMGRAARAARLQISDSGCGMDRATLDRAFEPFFTTKPVGRGTGLGLPVVYGLIRELGGTIALSSEPGRGTTVTILIPGKNGG